MVVYNVFLGIYLLEFVLKVYADPLGYWKHFYNLFDLALLVALVVHSILYQLELGYKGIVALKAIRGKAITNCTTCIHYYCIPGIIIP